MPDSKSLLKRFTTKGGVTGQIAKIYANDQEESAKFLLELKHQLKTNKKRFIGIWGKELIRELEQFS